MDEKKVNKLLFPFFIVYYLLKSYVFLILSEIMPQGISEYFHKLRGVKIGKNVFIDRHARIDGAYPEKITIEDEVRITAGACIMAHVKAGEFLRKNYFPQSVRDVIIKKYAFIGLNAVILPGVIIGEGAVVNCNSVVYQDVKPYTVVNGNPAKFISKLEKRN